MYKINASFDPEGNGTRLDCTQWETIGEDFIRKFATRDEAQAVCDELQADLANTDLDPTTEYYVVEEPDPSAAEKADIEYDAGWDFAEDTGATEGQRNLTADMPPDDYDTIVRDFGYHPDTARNYWKGFNDYVNA